MARTYVSKGRTILLRICQLLPKIHPELRKGISATFRPNKKGARVSLGRKTANRLRLA